MGLRAVAVISGARVWAASNEFAPATRPNQVGVGHVHGWRLRIVARAPRSQAARQKDKTRQTANGLPVHSFQTLLADLATLAKNRVRLPGSQAEFDVLKQPTPLQKRVFDQLGLQPQL